MPLQVEGSRIQVLGPVPSSNMMGSVRRIRELSDIEPQYVAKSGLCNASELESSRGGSIRIQHVIGVTNTSEGKSRFPKLDECAHFHYEHVEIGPLQLSIVDDDDLKPLGNECDEGKWWSLSVTSQNKTWLIRRSYDNFRMLDQQLHRCIYDRKFSGLMELPAECIEEQENIHKLLSDYVSRFSTIAGSLINCGPVLNWLELDNRGHRLLVPDTDNCPINTPAVAAAYSVKRYAAQAPDEISFEVGDMISVIDMPPPEESIWWRGKRGFQVGFFPCECVAVIGDKVPRNLQFSPQVSQPTKPVLRKHGKLIAFFRSFILSRPSRRRLKQSGILKERVFGCDLGEHLLNSGHEIPMVLKCCVEFIESYGLVDGIYRLSGVTSNIQKLRNAFDEDRVPALYEDEAILQDVHSVASLLKMYFRELPNPLCTYQLYHQFVGAVQTSQGDDTRLLKMRDVVQKLPPPHYRTLEYLMKHLARVSEKGHETGMTSRNVAIVWAPNLLRCKELEVGGVAALQGVGVQAVVTEFLVCYADLIFCDKLPNFSLPTTQHVSSKKSRPKSLAISTPTKLLSLEEARNRALLQAAGKVEPDYIEVGGGPASLPAKYHTVIELPVGSRKRLGSKRSPIGWKMLFGKSGRSSQSRKEMENKTSTTSDLGLQSCKAVTELDLAQTRRHLRPAKSVESLSSSRNSATLEVMESQTGLGPLEDTLSPMLLRSGEGKSNGHNRSVSHESYFDQLQDQRDDNALDISEIQLNFDLEESEMRIFSEDETLMSIGSGSLTSNNSPQILPIQKSGKYLVNKRLSYPKVAASEDRFSVSQSADPSPKKQKINDGTLPRSKLEEQLSSSVGDIQFIDSVSPDQVLVQAVVHPIQSPSPVNSISQLNSSLLAPSSPILPHIPHLQKPLSQTLPNQSNVDVNNGGKSKQEEENKLSELFSDIRPLSTISRVMNLHTYVTSPSLAEATVSDNESFSLQSSELTTPETPICRPYTPLVDLEESSLSNMTTPDLDIGTRMSSSETENLDRAMIKVNSEFDECQNIGREFAIFEEKISSDEVKLKYENISPNMVKTERLKLESGPPKPEERKPKPPHPYVNIPITRHSEVEQIKLSDTSLDTAENLDKTSSRNSVISIKYEVISTESSCDSLVNLNKAGEGSSLLASKTADSDNSAVEPKPSESACEYSNMSTNNSEEEKSSFPVIPSEMELLKECKDWLLTKQETLNDQAAFESSSDWTLIKSPVQSLETNSSFIDWTNSDHTRSTIFSSLSEKDTKFCDNFESEEMTKSELTIDNLTGQCEFLDNNSQVLVSKKEYKNEEPKINVERTIENSTEVKECKSDKTINFPISEPREKGILETNLDEVYDCEFGDIAKENYKIKEKPTPKKRTFPQKSNSSGNVRQLLSKFEISPTAEKNLKSINLDFDERKKAKEECQKDFGKPLGERPKTLERLSTRKKTEKDLNEPTGILLEKSKSGSHIDEKSKKVDILLHYEFDLSDPQRRERIERYKEKRRNYLREKYRSDSFKNEKDDFVLKIKPRHIPKLEGECSKETVEKFERVPSNLKNTEKTARKSSIPKLVESPKDSCKTQFSLEDSERLRYETSNSLREQSGRRRNFLRFSSERKSASDFRSTRSTPEKKTNHSSDFSFGPGRGEKLSPEFERSFSTRRRMTDPTRSTKSSEVSSDLTELNGSSGNINTSDKLLSGSSSTPSFCLKDVTTIFEKREDSKVHKQYLSSV